MTRASGGNLVPYSLRVPWDFLMTTESQNLGLMSHPKDNVKEKYNCRVFLLSTLICKCLSSILSTKFMYLKCILVFSYFSRVYIAVLVVWHVILNSFSLNQHVSGSLIYTFIN